MFMLKLKMDDQPNDPIQPSVALPSHIKHAHKFIFGYLIILVLVAAVGGMYSWQHKKVTNLNTQVASLNAQVNSLEKKLNSAQAAAQTTGPYAGWKTATLKYEKLTYQYPPN